MLADSTTEVFQDWESLQISPVFATSFINLDTGVPTWVVNQLMCKVEANLRLCPNEAVLAKDSANLLSIMVDKPEKAAKVLGCSGLWTVVRFLHSAPRCQPARRELARGVTLATAGQGVETERRRCINQMVQPFVERFESFVTRENFKQECHHEEVKLQMMDLLESFIGVVQGSNTSTAQHIFEVLRPVISRLAGLLGLYHNYSQIVEISLEFLAEITKRMLWYLDEVAKSFFLRECYLIVESYGENIANSHSMYESCLEVLRTYAQDHSGRRSMSQSVAEEDAFRDLLLLMEVLTSLLSKDLMDYQPPVDGGVAAVDICLYGLRIIMPLMTADLLKFPALCQQYYKMVSFAAEVYPERVSALPEDLLGNLFVSVQLGLSAFGPDISTMCCDFIYAMCSHLHSNQEQLENSQFRNMLHPFLKHLLNLILSGQINSDSMINASKALFGLVCCFQDTYQQLVGEILSAYSDTEVRNRLTRAFNELTTNITLVPQRGQVIRFRENFEKFIVNVHGFLLVK